MGSPWLLGGQSTFPCLCVPISTTFSLPRSQAHSVPTSLSAVVTPELTQLRGRNSVTRTLDSEGGGTLKERGAAGRTQELF